jgi:predicted PolB exonuclease-like 3'-5' exonuclease
MRRGQQPQHDAFANTDVVIYDIETIVEEEMEDGSFPPWPRHRAVAAAFLTARWSTEGYSFSFDTLMCKTGEEAAFLEKVEALLTSGITGVTYNGRGFDNRVLAIQAMRHCPGFGLRGLARQAFAGRFDGAHCDLADQIGGLGGARPVALAEICHALDIPIKTSTSGAEVGALWRAGEYQRIRDYVREDVCATYLVWLHFLAFTRSDEALLTLPLAQLAAWIETEPGLAHLRPFADCRSARAARARAPALKAKAAFQDAERRVTRERDEAAFAADENSPF